MFRVVVLTRGKEHSIYIRVTVEIFQNMQPSPAALDIRIGKRTRELGSPFF